ncbi:RNA binding protein, heterogenous nuclear RNP-K like protein, partial [Coemansia erecta]
MQGPTTPDDILDSYESDFEPDAEYDDEAPSYMVVVGPEPAAIWDTRPQQPVSSDNASAALALRIVFASDCGGVLIGKGGCHINMLKQTTSASWHITTGDVSDDRIVTVSGTPTSIAEAVGKLAEHIVDQTSPGSKTRDLLSCPSAPYNALTLNLLFPVKTIGHLLGPSGARISHLRSDRSIQRLHITKEPIPFTQERIVQVTGTAPGLQTAALAILQATEETLAQLQGAATLYRPVRNGLRSFLRMESKELREMGRKRSRSTADATDHRDRHGRDEAGKRPRRMSDHSDTRSASPKSRSRS